MLMKKISILNVKNGQTFGKIGENAECSEWVADCIAANAWGKPEREMIELSEPYNEADVISRREEAIGEGIISYVTLKCEYEITEEDLSINPQWLLIECYSKRRAEYPTLEELVEAIMEKDGEGRPAKFNQLHALRMEVKAKYPKP